MQAPRFLISAAHKSSGKTVISTGLAAALSARGASVATFKKGPDYIDPMWLGTAARGPCYNLDFNTMPPGEIAAFFAAHASASVNLIEANKGLFDGVAEDGHDSNAALARLLDLPVILVLDTNGMTRGIAPLLQGYQAFDPDVSIAGVILNKVGGPRHEAKLRAAVATYTDIPVIGAVHRNTALEIGERHLGLTTPAETGAFQGMVLEIGRIVGNSVDLDALEAIAATAPALAVPPPVRALPKPDLKIAIARDQAFGFYYPDDLEAFARAGAELVPFNTLTDPNLPAVDGLFIGGGFPEMFIDQLAANESLRADIRRKIQAGLPSYAECGGLMYLCQSMEFATASGQMVGVIPADAVMHKRPQGRGYAVFADTPDHPWSNTNAPQTAHEFHYARLENADANLTFARNITRGHGIDGQHDGVVIHKTLAGFCHLRTSQTQPWVADFVAFVRAQKSTT
ncbi:MAG TPA: cobyrinate a,c-diamide synthase [Aliiroseovarius sp.]|nr:cobyrinate a,c-diamide synthase [Aliiroseovarius sp.]